jgi:hypothetical protein
MADDDEGGTDMPEEPTAADFELGTTRPSKFHPERIFFNSAIDHGQNFVIAAVVDQSLLSLVGPQERATVPFFPYTKLELPRCPGATEAHEPIPLAALLEYEKYNITETYLDALRQELRRPDAGADTHTDVLVFKNGHGDDVTLKTFPDATVAAVALALPSDYPIPVYLRVLPQITHALLGRLIAFHGLQTMDAATQLETLSVLRLAYGPVTPGNVREVLYCAALCGPEHPAARSAAPAATRAAASYRTLKTKQAMAPLRVDQDGQLGAYFF